MSAITKEAVEELRAQLHETWRIRGWHRRASADAIWHFALGVGDDNPLWWDRSYRPLSAGHLRFAPPAFLYSCQGAPVPEIHDSGDTSSVPWLPPGTGDWLPGVGGLWAGDRWLFHDRIYLDEEISGVAELWDIREVEGDFAGPSVYHTTKGTFRGTDGRVLAEHFRTLIRIDLDAAKAAPEYASIDMPVYSAEDRENLQIQYLKEAGQRRGADVRYAEDVAKGDVIPGLLKGPLTLTSLLTWCAGAGSSFCLTDRMRAAYVDQHPDTEMVHPTYGYPDTLEGTHFEEAFAQGRGMPRGYDFGGQRISWFAHMLSDWYGDDGDLAELEIRLRRPNLLGDTQWLSGTVSNVTVEGERGRVSFELQSKNQRGEVTSQGRATVLLASRSAPG